MLEVSRHRCLLEQLNPVNLNENRTAFYNIITGTWSFAPKAHGWGKSEKNH